MKYKGGNAMSFAHAFYAFASASSSMLSNAGTDSLSSIGLEMCDEKVKTALQQQYNTRESTFLNCVFGPASATTFEDNKMIRYEIPVLVETLHSVCQTTGDIVLVHPIVSLQLQDAAGVAVAGSLRVSDKHGNELATTSSASGVFTTQAVMDLAIAAGVDATCVQGFYGIRAEAWGLEPAASASRFAILSILNAPGTRATHVVARTRNDMSVAWFLTHSNMLVGLRMVS